MKCIQIFKDGKMDELKINNFQINEKKIIKYLTKSSMGQGSNVLKKLYSWTFEGDKIHCYGWYDGEIGFENIHDLPNGGNSNFVDEDSSIKTLYGDIFILRIKIDKYIDLSISEYSVFYSDQYENFSNYSSEDEIIEDSKLTDEEDNDNTFEEYEIIENKYEELDYDTNSY